MKTTTLIASILLTTTVNSQAIPERFERPIDPLWGTNSNWGQFTLDVGTEYGIYNATDLTGTIILAGVVINEDLVMVRTDAGPRYGADENFIWQMPCLGWDSAEEAWAMWKEEWLGRKYISVPLPSPEEAQRLAQVSSACPVPDSGMTGILLLAGVLPLFYFSRR